MPLQCAVCGALIVAPHAHQKFCSPRCRAAMFLKLHPRKVAPEYHSWKSMLQRCTNPKNKAFARYGGRGIVVCERWRTFQHFMTDMGPQPSPEHSIDRINNDGNYEPGNCRWATVSQNNSNKSTCFKIEYNGRIQTATEWAQEIGVSRQAFTARLKRGYSLDEAMAKGDRRFN